MVVFGKIVCNRAKWLYMANVVVIWQKLLYSCNLVVFGQSCCIRARWLNLDKSEFYRAKVAVFGIKVVVFGHIGCIR